MEGKIVRIFSSLLLAIIIVVSGCAPGVTPSQFTIPSVAGGEVLNPKFIMADCYEPNQLSISLNAPDYALPLDLNEVTNFEEVESTFYLTESQRQLLQENGFVIISWHGDDIVQPYKTLKEQEIPIFVTSDTLLHLYHIQFNEILKRLEEEEFFDELIDMSLAMMDRSVEDYQSFGGGDLREAARRNVAYFTVALSLLQTPTEGYDEEAIRQEIEQWNKEYPWDKKEFKPLKKVEFTVPSYVVDEVNEEISNIEAHEGFKPSAIFNSQKDCQCDLAGCYCEDYSQYVPRGHYTRSEALKRYFKAMMWYGRMAFLLKGGDNALISEKDARIATIQASLISAELPGVSLPAGQGNLTTCWDTWSRIYSVTSFFVGTADDLTPYEYLDAMEKVLGNEFNATQLADDEILLNLEAELAQMRNPQIYGGSGVCVIEPPVTKEKLYECLAKTIGLRFMGQRFVPDSYMFQNLVSPAVGMYVGDDEPFTMGMTALGSSRCFPRGLDAMAVLGSERAYQILDAEGDTEYQGENTSYEKQLKELKEQFAAFSEEDWNRNLYWSWLYTLKPLLSDFGQGYPTFMQTEAWQDKELQTALASWTELRHDTILYAKQSYTPAPTAIPPQPQPVVGYVEPVPEFYNRMLSLTTMTREGLGTLNALSDEEKSRLESLENILDRLITISQDELEGKELSEDDYEFIRNFGQQLDSIVTGVEAGGKETTLVADVHTDANSERVLEEGVGYVDLALVAYKVPDGNIILGAGPTFSYYEFKQPMSDRLTDEQWKELLEQGQQPSRPDWIDSFYVK
ncbi:MAG TPA: DUF3160 domain-containing protein [Dehalococcoidia bacterium]|nr:DUF3160 domain-containing protein [Dehalococcoidia bacterium]